VCKKGSMREGEGGECVGEGVRVHESAMSCVFYVTA
jgi:hypothetical protein